MVRSGSRIIAAVGTVCALAFGCAATAATADASVVRAGAAGVDASWHVGASAGQYASDGTPVGEHGVDPGLHSTRRAPSYGLQSRLSARALVVEGPDGKRFAIVKQDLYIPQDLLWRRTAQILEQGDSGIGHRNLTMAASHSHSSPYYSSPSWGVWAFQDVFDVRFYDYYAKRMAAAVEEAADHLEPVRVSAARTKFEGTARNSMGPAVADDGTPAGYPYADSDTDMTVIRFDSVKRRRTVGNLVNYNLHGEGLEGNDLISADWVAPLQRMVDRATGGVTVYTQNALGTAEPEKSLAHSIHDRLEFSHRQYAQGERAARLMSDSILKAWRAAGGRPARGVTRVDLGTQFPVATADRWFPGPLSHPFPTVSNCRTDQIFEGNPQAPVVGLPDCTGPGQSPWDEVGQNPGISTDDLERAGVPVPENYGALGYTGLEEDLGIHLQAIRLGDVLLTICSCEQWADQSRNIKTRTDSAQGNEYLGYDWGAQCEPADGGTWSCPDPRDTTRRLPPIGDHEYQRMRAQVNNDAAGWNDPSYVPWAESEPDDPKQIKGNYTHSELPPEHAYKMTVTVGMANDYNGYIATYREYQRGDHYRKALTAWGPHSSDYMATRLVEMGGALKGGPEPDAEPLDAKNVADQAHQDARAASLGTFAAAYVPAYEATLPDDGGQAEVTAQPKDIERFDAASLTWTGGSNYTDDPVVRVQRRTRDGWEDYADQTGELPVTLKYPQLGDVPGYETGGHAWKWTAWFEAFASELDDLGARPSATPAGTYRFLVRGRRREGHKVVAYSLKSRDFVVRPWDGITVPAIGSGRSGVAFDVGPTSTYRLPSAQPSARPVETKVSGAGEGDVVATVGPIDYPDSYKSGPKFINATRTALREGATPNDPAKFEWFCFDCSFRPWADVGAPSCATVTYVSAAGRESAVRATRRTDGRWLAPRALRSGEVALVQPGGIRDGYGQVNGKPSSIVGEGTPRAQKRAAELADGRTRCGASR